MLSPGSARRALASPQGGSGSGLAQPALRQRLDGFRVVPDLYG